MLDDGEKLVPGFRQARALRVWTGVRPLFEDAKAADTDTRDVTRAHALLDHRERDGVDGFVTITGGKLTTFRLMAEQTVDAVCDMLGSQRAVHDRDPAAARLRERRALPARRAARAQGGAAARRADDLRVRAGVRATKLEQALRQHRLDQPRRHPPAAAPGDGAVPGRLLHLPRGRDHARRRRRSAPSRPTRRCSTFLQERWKGVWPILYGDQLRQMRFDEWIFHGVLDVDHLPAGVRARGEPAPALRRGRDRCRHRRAGRRRPGWRRPGASVCVIAKGVGSTHLAPGTIDVLGYAPERRRVAARGDRGARRPRARITPTRCSASSSSPRPSTGSSRRLPSGPLPGYALRRQPRAQPAAADRRGRAQALGAGARDVRRGRLASSSGRVAVVGHAAAARLPRRSCAPATCAPPGSRRPRSTSTSSSTAPTPARSGSPAASTIRRWRAGFSARLAPLIKAADQVGAAGDARAARPACGAARTSRRGSAAACSRFPTLPPSVPGMRLFEILRHALRARRRQAGARRGRRRAPARRRSRGLGATRRRPARTRPMRPTRSCSPRADSTRAPSRSTRTGRRTSRCSACRCGRARRRRAALRAVLLRRAAARAGRRRSRRRAARQRVPRTWSSPAPRFRASVSWREALRRGHRAGQRLSRGAGRSRAETRRGGGGWHDRSGRARRTARLARSLREVHDLRDRLPGLERVAAVPRAQVRRPAIRALPRRRTSRASTRRSTTARAAGSARRSARRA